MPTELPNRLAGLELSDWALLIGSPFVGSFLGVVIRRLPERRPIVLARSACTTCGRRLGPCDLVPLFSWLLARGRCRHCGHALGWFYPAVELAALAVAVIAIAVDNSQQAWLDCLFGWWLLALGWIDLRHLQLPDVLTLPLLVAGLIIAAVFDPEGLANHAAAAALGYLVLRAIAETYRRLRRRQGLGQGDAKLLAAAGAWLGIAALPQVILFAALAALITAAGLSVAGSRLQANTALPFGPFLALAIWSIWLFGVVPL